MNEGNIEGSKDDEGMCDIEAIDGVGAGITIG